MTIDKPELMTLDDAYNEFFASVVTKQTFRNWITKGYFTRVKIDQKLFFDRKQLIKEIEGKKERLGKFNQIKANK